MNRRDLRVSFLVSMREDSIAKLDFFKGRIPNLFDNYLRIDHLDSRQAHDAIVKPVERFNQTLAPGEAPITLSRRLPTRCSSRSPPGALRSAAREKAVSRRATPRHRPASASRRRICNW